MLNIGGDASDASYRYKMPRLVTKVEGRGNGIKTVIVNMVDIAKALHVTPGYPTKFFGIELGAQSKFNPDTERAIVNGSHDQKDMAKMLEKFIGIFVLCPTCRLPEIKMNVKKSSIKIDCAACGHNGALQTTHKLLTYILKSNSDGKKKGKDKDGKKDKKDKDGKKKKKKGEAEEEAKPAEEATAEGEDGEEPKKKEKKKKEEEEKVEWCTDTSKGAQKKRKEEEFLSMKQNEFIKDVDAIMEAAGSVDTKEVSPATVLRVFLASGHRTPIDVVNEVKRLQLSRGLDETQRIKVVLEAVIDVTDPKKVASEFTKNAPLLKKFAHDKSTGTILLNCLEELLGVIHAGLMGRVPLILQALYEGDVLEEETIMSWFDSPPESSWLVSKDVAVAVRNKAQPFISWLKEAEEEDDDEEE